MDTKRKNYFLLMMGGVGSRFGASIPKQFTEVEGRPLFLYVLDAVETQDCVDGVVVVSHPDWIGTIQSWIRGYKKILAVAPGGNCRSKSVYNGLSALKKVANPEDNVLIHDATHPHLDTERLPSLIEKIDAYGAATMVTSEYDTCYIKDADGFIDHVVDRKTIAVGASPEGFKFGVIFPIYDNATDDELEAMTSAGAILIANGQKMATVNSDLLNLKITYQNDMELFRILCRPYYHKEH